MALNADDIDCHALAMVVDTPLLVIVQIHSPDRTPLDYPQISNAAALHLPKAVAASKQSKSHNYVTAQTLGARINSFCIKAFIK